MEQTKVQKLARLLNVLVTAALWVNIAALALLPGLLYYDPHSLLEGTR